MHIEVKFNFWFFISTFVLMVFLILFTILFTKIMLINDDFNLKIKQLEASNVKWIYDCREQDYISGMWQCPIRLYNLTGAYCNGTMVCKNEYRILDGGARWQ